MTAAAPRLGNVPAVRDHAHLDAAARAAALRVFSHIRHGELEIIEESGQRHRFGSIDGYPLRAEVHVRRPSFYRSLLRGSIGGR